MLFVETVKKIFKRFYGNSFNLVLMNMLWSVFAGMMLVLTIGAIRSGVYIILIIPLFFAGPLLLVGVYLGDMAFDEKMIRFRDLWKGFKKHFKRGLKGFVLPLIIYTILFIDFYFFFNISLDSILLTVLFFVILFITLVFSMMQLYYWGLLIIYPDLGILALVKRSFVLTFDNFMFTFLWFIFLIIILFIFYLVPALLPPLFISFWGTIIASGTKMILYQY